MMNWGQRTAGHFACGGRFFWPDTFIAEYLALTQLQADALVVRDAELGRIASRRVTVAPLEDLLV